MKNFQNLISYDDYEVSPTDEEIQAFLLNENPPADGFTPDAFFYGIEDIFGKLPLDEPFGYEQHGAKLSLIFSGVPSFPFLLSIFSMVQSKLMALWLEGINEVTFNAGKDDEVVHQNVTSILQPNQSSIPLILLEVQTYHLNKSRSAEG
ncbi:hypothetical protein [Hymenobacter nivis]|uniref:hypothetical protein n=1 Tax=Hymenobacter nivis TaxID=1850093 RepID=UPI0013A533F0|nr:hypothetical protein [Hymenobacter nivis]